MDRAKLRQARILICDDQQANVVLLERMLATAGYANVTSTTEGRRVVELCAESPPDLILLDLHMPEVDGFEVMERLVPFLEGAWLPILALTADTTPEAKQRAFTAGAKDFLTKPLDRPEVLLRVENLLEARFLQAALRDHNARLEGAVTERTRSLQQRTEDLDEARFEVLERLALAAEYRDDATGEHVKRVGRTAALLLCAAGVPEPEVELLRLAATLHDVGKIGISDSILLKPGRLTPREYETMKTHVGVSCRILSGSRSPLLQRSAEIAGSHHERWDGSGYPRGLSGERIPLSGRAVAIADVFDALANERPYKPAWSIDRAVAEILAQSGRHFDPRLVEAFAKLDHPRLVQPVGASGDGFQRPVAERRLDPVA